MLPRESVEDFLRLTIAFLARGGLPLLMLTER
jgi:hypothetical protein